MSLRRKRGGVMSGLVVAACVSLFARLEESIISPSSVRTAFFANAGIEEFGSSARTPGFKPLERPDVVYCYAPGTPDDVVKSHAYPLPAAAGPTPLFNVQSRWSGADGTPRALTWSFIPDGVTVDGETSELFSRMDTLFASAGGRAAWIAQFQWCFDRWSALAGLSYTRVRAGGNDWDDGAAFGSGRSSTRGDIRIAMIVQDGLNDVLAYNYYPSNGDMVLDRAENWASGAGNHLFLRNVILHEHGHGLGLRHVCPVNQTKLMEPFLSLAFEGPQHDDIRGAHQLYGDRYELNNSSGSAASLGTLSSGSTITIGPAAAPAVSNGSVLSIEADTVQDYFKFVVSMPTVVNVTVAPVGLTYDSSVQNANSSCSSGNLVNSLAMADLGFDVIGTNGNTVLRSVNAALAGNVESTVGVILPEAGTYYIRIFESNVPAQPQLFTLSVSDSDCNHNGVPDANDLQNGTSQDCNANFVPDDCEIDDSTDTNHNSIPDACERRHGDFDLDGDVDLSDFGHLQRCLLAVPSDPQCFDADLDGNAAVAQSDVTILIGCLSGPDTPYAVGCH